MPSDAPRSRVSNKKLLLVSVVVSLLLPKVLAEYSYLTVVRPGVDTNSYLRAFRTLEALPYFGRAPLLRLLRDPNVGRRAQAARSLSSHSGDSVLDALIEAARHDKGSIQMEALRSLGRIGDPRAIPAMEELARVSGYAEEPLTWMGPEGRDALIRVVDDEGTEDVFRAGALYYLCKGEHGNSRQVGDCVERAMLSDAPELRSRAANCLASAPSTTVERLEALLGDANPGVRIAAADGLRVRGNRAGREVLRQVIEDGTIDEELRARAIKELQKFESREDVDLLWQLREDDPSSMVRRSAEIALELLHYAGVDIRR